MTSGPGFSDGAMAPDGPRRRRDKTYCGGRKRQGEGTCTRPAGWGTSHVGIGACKLHGGTTPTHVALAARQQQEQALAAAVRTYGVPVDVEPGDALLGLVRSSAGHVAWLAKQVGDLEEHRVLAGDKPNPLVTLYQEERRELARVSKMTLDAGVAERRVRLAEAQGQLVVAFAEHLVAGLAGLVAGMVAGGRPVALDVADPQVRAVVHAALLTIEGETA